MLHDVPEPGAARVVVPRHRVLRAQALEHLVVLEALEPVEVEEVDRGSRHRDSLTPRQIRRERLLGPVSGSLTRYRKGRKNVA